ncbi:hypothetical protein P43SY_011423 [Pythium insidiosum]|uniref:Uncharacterized protein n=1 Tax=Pythium insidiosum TaxID=114742 RepID=A0AAD5Q5A5_PYTIN|nr:hypothetical protein P43SY_011423 [Pythium insidiosum]KAJ0392658.1 hypothetical protein ATCC90586_011183 [Pythium insidiosum]
MDSLRRFLGLVRTVSPSASPSSTPSTMHSADECSALSHVAMFPKYHELGEGCSTMSQHLQVVFDTLGIAGLLRTNVGTERGALQSISWLAWLTSALVQAGLLCDYSDTRIYQILTHAITRAPSFLDVRATQRAAATQWPQHRIEHVKPSGERGARLCSVALTGRAAEDNRMIRANAPFKASGARVAVVATSHDAFVVGLVAGG